MGFMIVEDVVRVVSVDVKFAELCVVLKRLFPGLKIRSRAVAATVHCALNTGTLLLDPYCES